MQRIAVAVQRGNAASVLGSLGSQPGGFGGLVFLRTSCYFITLFVFGVFAVYIMLL